MPEYLRAWKLFRANSDENRVTAEFVLRSALWPQKKSVDVCDLGCGDGLLLAEVLAKCPSVNKVRLVDPDNDLLLEAEAMVEEKFPGTHVSALLNSVREGWPRCAGNADVILAIHLVYLIEEDELQALVRNRPPNAAMFVVLDAPHSVFTELWRWTADKYFRRSKRAHEVMRNSLGLSNTAPLKTIKSKISKSLLVEHELSDWLLSILCYRNMLEDVPAQLKDTARRILDEHTDSTGNFIECESLCYEFPPSRLSAET